MSSPHPLSCAVGGDASHSTSRRSSGLAFAIAVLCAGLSPEAMAGARLAGEGQKFVVSGSQAVRFGVGQKWVTRQVAGEGACTARFFGSDPAPGATKQCEIADPSPAASAGPTASPTPATSAGSLAPTVDAARIPAPAGGYSTARVRAANVAAPGQTPVSAEVGAFREYCEFSHMAYDDPIVFPGAASPHLHTFLGNTGINRNSTAASVAGGGNSTCAGGTLNRTGYWVPSMIDTQSNTPLKPNGSLIYYKVGYHYVDGGAIQPFPAGLRMVAGNAASAAPQSGAIAGFVCYRPDGSFNTSPGIPTDCPSGSTLTTTVTFPQCWDGANLDSPDHKSHMAYATIGCPRTHPVVLTEISFQINYPVTGAAGTRNWRLSSDNYDRGQPGGYSSHADWYNGWDTTILNTWTTRCVNASMDCHAYLIGDGRILY